MATMKPGDKIAVMKAPDDPTVVTRLPDRVSEADDAPLLGQVLAGQLVSETHTILIRPYAFGQLRIQLCRSDRPDPYAPPGHGSIVRELCTYEPGRAVRVVTLMRVAPDPEAYCCTLETPWNCEEPGRGRIRLDNMRPAFVCPNCGAQSYNTNDAEQRYCARCKAFVDD